MIRGGAAGLPGAPEATVSTTPRYAVALLAVAGLGACTSAPPPVSSPTTGASGPGSTPTPTPPTSDPGDTPTDPTSPGSSTTPPAEDPRDLPVVFIHGIDGDASNWDVVIDRLIADGWPADQLYAHTFDDPSWGCNVDNAATIAVWVDAVLAETGADRINLVAHSMGTLSSRYFVKHLGGTDVVNTYATLGGMHHGLLSSCSPDFPGKPCVWDEICTNGDYVADLNADPSTPGALNWVSIYGTADTTVPNWSSELDGAENLPIEGVEHFGPTGLLEDEATYGELSRVLGYPRW